MTSTVAVRLVEEFAELVQLAILQWPDLLHPDEWLKRQQDISC